MKEIFTCANGYIQARDWKMIAFLKFCLASGGLLLGLLLPPKHRKPALIIGIVVFLATYIPLMIDFIRFAVNFFKPEEA